VILDANGRSVARLASPSGPARWSWDARDSEGRQVAPGVYYARVGGRNGATTRIVVVR
jgi:flagellar hook assembly protein FlgD